MNREEVEIEVIWMLNDLLNSVKTNDEKKSIIRGFNLGMYMGCLFTSDEADKLMNKIMIGFKKRYCAK